MLTFFDQVTTSSQQHLEANCHYTTIQEYARKYLEAGFRAIPILPGSKKPACKNWPDQVLRVEDVAATWSPYLDHQIGIVLGTASGGLVDIDVDDPDALPIASSLLPATPFTFGHASKRASHFVYRVKDPGKTQRFSSAKKTIVEYRADGGQTVFPGSRHESGEMIDFEQPIDLADPLPTPSESTQNELLAATRRLAIATLLLKAWGRGTRHNLALATAGFLAQHGWPEERVVHLIETVAGAADDEEISDRLKCVHKTFEKIGAGEKARGRSGLEELLDATALNSIKKWVRHLSGSRSMAEAETDTADLLAEDDFAGMFADHHREDIIYCSNTAQWFTRTHHVFTPAAQCDMQGKVSIFVEQTCRSVDSEKVTRRLKSRSRMNSTIELARPRLTRYAAEIDADPLLLGLNDGAVLDLRTGLTSNPGPAIITKRLGAKFDPSAQCPGWLAFLNKIFEDNEEVIAFLQRACGYSLSGDTREQCMFVAIGRGANGKTTFMNVLNRLLGDYATTVPMHTLMVNHHGTDKTNDVAGLVGSRLVYASEGESGQRLAEAKIKLLTGGDLIKCRALYSDYFTFTPQFKLWLVTNDLPAVSGTDISIWRRILVINFPVTIPPGERDLNRPGITGGCFV